MKTYEIIGFFVGFIVAILALVIFYKITNKKGNCKNEYDERQNLIRGKGYKFAYLVLVTYVVIYGIVAGVLDIIIMDPLTAAMIGLCLSVLVYAIYTYWNDAYLGLNYKEKNFIGLYIVIIVINLFSGIMNCLDGKVLVDNQLTSASVNLICAITFIILLIAFLLKKFIKKEED